MARTYLSTLSPRRRWGIAGAAAGLALVATVGLGEPWGDSAISGLPLDPGGRSVPLLAGTLQVFHWTTSSSSLGGSGPWAAAIVLDLVWPLLILIGARALAGGLALRRARLSLCVGVWSIAALTGAFAGLIAGLVDHSGTHSWARVAFVAVTPHTPTGDVLTLQAATMALVGVVLGWLPGVAASIAYSVKRHVPGSASGNDGNGRSGSSGGSSTLTGGAGATLELDGLEGTHKGRRERDTPSDARSSDFFKV